MHERIEFYIHRNEDLEKEKATSLQDRLQIRGEEMKKEAEEKRAKRKGEAEKKRQDKEQAAKVKTEYGDDVRVEGEHDEDDMMAQMGFAGFGSSKK